MLNSITGLRFFAALLVVGFHFLTPYLGGIPVLGTLISHGYVGVTLFFVLSGFIMVYVNSRRSMHYGTFAWARVARLYPLYLFSLLIALPFALKGAKEAGWDWHWLASFALTPVLLQAWVPQTFLWNSPAWSLSVEALWYAVFPLLLPVVLRARAAAVPAMIMALWVLGLLAPTAYHLVQPDGPAYGWPTSSFWIEFVKFNPLLHLPDFLIGALIGRMFVERLPVPRWLTAVGTGVGLAALVFADRIPYILMHNGLLLVPFAVLIRGLAQPSRATGWLAWRPLVLLGEASYALYILHVPLHMYWSTALKVLGIRESLGSQLLYLPFVILASIAAFRWLEQPAQRYLLARRRITAPASVPAAPQAPTARPGRD